MLLRLGAHAILRGKSRLVPAPEHTFPPPVHVAALRRTWDMLLTMDRVLRRTVSPRTGFRMNKSVRLWALQNPKSKIQNEEEPLHPRTC